MHTFIITNRNGKTLTFHTDFDSETAANRFLRLINDGRAVEVLVYRNGEAKPVMMYLNPNKYVSNTH